MAKRYVTIDFLRGLAIWLMLFLHSMMRWIDKETIQNTLGDQELIIVFIFLGAIFFGSWCGFFLLMSAIGNMISMQNSMKRGLSPMGLAFRQIIGGFILLFFAMLSQSVLGYQAALGWLLKNGFVEGKGAILDALAQGAFVMEAIHAVAYCVIVNGAVHAILCFKGGHLKTRRNMIIYALLAIIVVALTPWIWNLFEPIGRGNFATDNAGELFIKFLGLPFDMHPEPLFPFLAVSFIGSMIGIWLTQDHRPNIKFITRGLWLSLIVLFIGLVGTIVLVFSNGNAFDRLLADFWSIPFLRGPGYESLWFWWFLCITAAQTASVLLVLRLVEFRGNAKPFAKYTVYWRRFGFVALTIYNSEFFDLIPVALWALIPGIGPYSTTLTFNKYVIWPVVFTIFLVWQGILLLWEKAHYVFSFEWLIAKISAILIPDRRKTQAANLPWWQDKRLDPMGGLKEIEGIDIVLPEEVHHKEFEDSKMFYKLSWMGFLFFPIGLIIFLMIFKVKKSEAPNKYLKRTMIITGIQTGIIILVFVASLFLTLNKLGLSLF